MTVHDLDCHLGERSPLRWLYDAGGAILLLGVGYSTCTAFHLAEYRRKDDQAMRRYHCVAVSGGTRATHQFTDIVLDDSDFELIGVALDAATWPDSAAALRYGRVGMAECTLLPMSTAVDFALSWMEEHRVMN